MLEDVHSPPSSPKKSGKRKWCRQLLVLATLFSLQFSVRRIYKDTTAVLSSAAGDVIHRQSSILGEVKAQNATERRYLVVGNKTLVVSNITSGTLSDRKRLLHEWKAFESYWANGITLAKYQQSVKSKLEVPSKEFPDFIVPQSEQPSLDIVLASHMSMGGDNLERLDVVRRFWQGPISLAIRMRAREEIESFFDYYEDLQPSTNWTIHFIFEYAAEGFHPKSLAAQYCHNKLRNLALHSPAISDFILGVDLDFVPTYEGYPKLMKIMEEHPHLWEKLKDKTLLVLPVMEVLHIPESLGLNTTSLVALTLDKTGDTASISTTMHKRHKVLQDLHKVKTFGKGVESDLPKSREELEILFHHGIAQEWHNPKGHAPTNLEKYWKYNKKRNATTEVTYSITPSIKYEPYFIGYKPDLPLYWEAFRGFGLNKQSFVRECILAGFLFEGLYQLYLTHLAHPSNSKFVIWKLNREEWVERFKPYLWEKYTRKPKRLKGSDWYSPPN